MRLLTEHMSVPEVNVAVVSNKYLNNKKTGAENKETDSTENRNLQLARCVEEKKETLIHALANFPVTALWLLHKYEQACDKADSDDETVLSADLIELLKNIKKHYQAIIRDNKSPADNDTAETRAKQRLRAGIKEFPFAFEDLIKLVDIIAHAFKFRGLTYKQGFFPEKKDFEVVSKRLDRLSSKDNSNLAGQFKAMDLYQHEERFLFLAPDEMSQKLAEVILAEHDWLNYRHMLATSNSKLVLFIANQYKGNFLDFDDLVQEGHTGLLKAVDRFKYRLGFQFSTYAGYWIRQAISRSLSRSERVVRIPCGQIATINRVYKAKDELTSKTGQEPTVKALAEYVKLSPDEVNNILAISQTSVPLENFDEDEDDQSFAPIDFLEQKVFCHSYSQIAENQLQNLICSAIKTLNAREAKILCSHFGIGKDHQMTLQEIGAELNLTRERVRQIQVVALNKIRLRYGAEMASFL